MHSCKRRTSPFDSHSERNSGGNSVGAICSKRQAGPVAFASGTMSWHEADPQQIAAVRACARCSGLSEEMPGEFGRGMPAGCPGPRLAKKPARSMRFASMRAARRSRGGFRFAFYAFARVCPPAPALRGHASTKPRPAQRKSAPHSRPQNTEMDSILDESMDIIPVAAPAAQRRRRPAPAEARAAWLRRSATATPILSAAANAAITPGAISNAYASCGSTPGTHAGSNDFKLGREGVAENAAGGVAAAAAADDGAGLDRERGRAGGGVVVPSPAAPPSSSLSFGRFVGQQLGWEPDDGAADYDLEDDRRRRGVYNFLQVPWNLEPLLLFGFCTCLDAFVTLYTFLPLRIVAALAGVARGGKLTPDQRCDVLCGLLIVAESALLLRFDVSQWYHYVRIQTMIKLYVVFNVLEIFDKLCASFGQARRRQHRHHHLPQRSPPPPPPRTSTRCSRRRARRRRRRGSARWWRLSPSTSPSRSCTSPYTRSSC